MTSLQLYLKDGKWYGNEFPEEPIKGEYELPYAKAMKKYHAAVEKAKSEALEISNPEEFAFKDGRGWHVPVKGILCAEWAKEGVLYPWEGEWEIEYYLSDTDPQWIIVSEKLYEAAKAYPESGRSVKRVLRLLPKSPVTTWTQEGDIVTVSGRLKLKPVTNPEGIGDPLASVGDIDAMKSPVIPEGSKGAGENYPVIELPPKKDGSLCGNFPRVLKGGIVAIGGISEHSQNYICLNCKHVYGYEPDSCAECNCKTFHKTDAGISEQDEDKIDCARKILSISEHNYKEAAPVNDAVGGKDFTEEDWQRLIDEHSNEPQNSTNRDWYWYLRGMREGYGQAEFEGHKRGSQPSPQAERQDDVLLSWLEEERNILQNSATLMWHDMETRGRAKHVAQCITTTLDYIRESKTRKP